MKHDVRQLCSPEELVRAAPDEPLRVVADGPRKVPLGDRDEDDLRKNGGVRAAVGREKAIDFVSDGRGGDFL